MLLLPGIAGRRMFKKNTMKACKIASFILGALLLLTCQDNNEDILPPDPPGTSTRHFTLTSDCEFVQTLWSARDTTKAIAVGSVRAVLKYPDVYFTFSPDNPLKEIQVWVSSDLKKISRHAAPGQLNIRKELSGVNMFRVKIASGDDPYTLKVDVSRLGIQPGQLFYAAVCCMGQMGESYRAYGDHTLIELGVAQRWGWAFAIDPKKCQALADGDPCPGLPVFIDPRDGNEYKTVWINGQCWFKENLRYLPRVEAPAYPYYSVYAYYGTSVEQAKATANYRNYGVLYAGYTLKDACPDGWHVSTDQEWTLLTDYLQAKHNLHPSSETDIAPLVTLLNSCRQVQSPLGGDCDTYEHPRWIQHDAFYGQDLAGFSALPGGLSEFDFQDRGEAAYFWTSTIPEEFPGYLFYRRINYNDTYVFRTSTEDSHGMSIRCVKDEH
jgi:uncharacterized protein (TIGR02145 family)